MDELLTAAQMREEERAAIEGGLATGLELMERAGRGVVDAVFSEWPDLAEAPHRALVLCGPGNNGGDGFVVARLLRQWGWEVEVLMLGDPGRLPPDARTNHDLWRGMGPVATLDDAGFAGEGHEGVVLVVDALFGTGLGRPVTGLDTVAGWIGARRAGGAATAGSALRVVAVDCPSGLDVDSGRFLVPAEAAEGHRTFGADLTVTFHRAKLGHYLAEGPGACGQVRVVDIGLPDTTHRDAVQLVTGPRHPLSKRGAAHKYDHGHALVLSGGAGRGGAARMAARGALRIGAGLVTVGCPPGALQENAARLDAIMLRSLSDPDALSAMLEDRRLNALCLGPGLGVERAAGMIPPALQAPHAPRIVFDADALTAIANDPALFEGLHGRCVLTPHAGEFARLFPDIADRLGDPPARGPAFSRVDATRAAAARAGCTVLFKGADTVIADPSGRCAISSADYERCAPWLATAGAGDVLSGLIAGLLARGADPFEAAATASWVHVEAARAFGPGLVAEDLPEALPGVLRRLEDAARPAR